MRLGNAGATQSRAVWGKPVAAGRLALPVSSPGSTGQQEGGRAPRSARCVSSRAHALRARPRGGAAFGRSQRTSDGERENRRRVWEFAVRISPCQAGSNLNFTGTLQAELGLHPVSLCPTGPGTEQAVGWVNTCVGGESQADSKLASVRPNCCRWRQARRGGRFRRGCSAWERLLSSLEVCCRRRLDSEARRPSQMHGTEGTNCGGPLRLLASVRKIRLQSALRGELEGDGWGLPVGTERPLHVSPLPT